MSTVRGLRTRRSAISRFARPTATRRTHLQLAARQARRPRPAAAARRPSAADDRLAERGDLAGRLGGQRPRAQPAGGAVGLDQALQRRLAVAGGGQRHAGAQLDLRPLERDLQGALDVQGAAELVRRGVGVAGGERGLADGGRECGERLGAPGLGGDPRQGLGAGAGLGARPAPGEVRRRPSGAPRARRGGPRWPPRESSIAAQRGSRPPRARPRRRPARRARRSRPPHVVVADPRGDGERGGEQPPGRALRRPWKAWIGADHPLDHPDPRAGGDQVAAELQGPRPTPRARAARRPGR